MQIGLNIVNKLGIFFIKKHVGLFFKKLHFMLLFAPWAFSVYFPQEEPIYLTDVYCTYILTARDIPVRTQSTQDVELCSGFGQGRCVAKDNSALAQRLCRCTSRFTGIVD